MSKIIVVGGGAAGLELVTRLGRSLGRRAEHTITLVEPASHHYWKPRLHEIAAGTFDNELDAVSYLQHAACHGYQYVQAAMTGLDRSTKTITVSQPVNGEATLDYDYLVLAVGAISNDFKTPGVSEHCLFLDSAEQAQRAWALINPLLRTQGEHRLSIVGAGATGVELAAELAKVSEKLQRYRHGASLSITLVEAADRVLPASPACMSEKVQRKLEQQGVTVLTNTRIQRAESGRLVTADDQVLTADLQIWAAGIKCADWLTQLDGLETNRINQLKVHDTLQSTLDEAIFVMGDSAECPQPDGSFVPPRAQAANQAAGHLAHQFARLMKGKPLQPFLFNDGGMVVALGHDYAVGALMNDKVVLRGRLVRNLYDTIFRLHQRILFGWGRVTALVMLKRIKGLLSPYYKGNAS
ncbi:NAD(P)/FAD-dependent oxidoreductase [Photobacterium aphoticum]|uniref:NADH dehydrogenase n=1 Tax=Photobacterium aphoticum TaxID=754436 RepID=A0A0J1JCX9_9GAMM|nr:NAD(P)/FAD-dependent oxidoreductase [Photobacterium aphoticum]KLU99521.1 NADH dehydrogenase [Photobacterium aphoticum]PSU57105.1 NAD(P)/FAD-dependent oxidoreductase [Photobacterium aphoticum]GHA52998.1 NADH dehydrogenase [Photobacterium aphoticum]